MPQAAVLVAANGMCAFARKAPGIQCHPWIRDHGVAPDHPLDTAVLSRIKQFYVMNKLKKMALRAIYDFYWAVSLSPTDQRLI
ncbi:hypothetical protein ZWY2020_033079 [Hordeum vulgare]|nr:hypothetical protein ZWY2020_033079 [Hordeum vulgare]